MEKILEIAIQVSTPLALGGFVMGCFFLYLWITSTRKKTRSQSSISPQTLSMVYVFLFSLSMVALVLGFVGYVMQPAQSVELSSVKPSPSPEPPDLLEDQLVNVDFRDEDIKKVLESIARQMGAVLVVNKNIAGSFSISAKNSKARHILDQICEVKSCKWKTQEGDPPALLVIPLNSSEETESQP